MPDFDVYTLPESEVTISNGAVLDGVTQGDGSHLLGETITLNSNNWEAVTVSDNDSNFADNDGNQTLANAITYDGVAYSAGRRVEAEYTLTVEDPDGNTYTIIAFNIVEPGGGNPYSTVEGLAFIDPRPPIGVPLTVVGTAEGPSNSTYLFDDYFTPPCFVSGTLIRTPDGEICVEELQRGDLVVTFDNGPQKLEWVGSVHLTRDDLINEPRLMPILLNWNHKVLRVSPQHRVLASGWNVEMICGESEVLVTAKHMVGRNGVRRMKAEEIPAAGITYCHLMFAQHQIIYSDGIPTESFRPGPETKASMPEAWQEFRRLFPELTPDGANFPLARRVAKAFEARVI